MTTTRRDFLRASIAGAAAAAAAARGADAASDPVLGLIFPPKDYPVPPEATRLYPTGVRFLSRGIGLERLTPEGYDAAIPKVIPAAESLEWTVRTVEHAVRRGASVVSIIPVRGGNGEMERLQSLGDFVPPTLAQLENALDACVQMGPAVVTADLWDVDRFSGAACCRQSRVARMNRMNLTGQQEPRILCDECRA